MKYAVSATIAFNICRSVRTPTDRKNVDLILPSSEGAVVMTLSKRLSRTEKFES